MPGFKGKSVHIDDRHLHVASISEIRQYRFICDGTGIEWQALDYHLSIEAMLSGNARQTAA